MKITTIKFKNFRCFGEETTISLDKKITVLIGANGSGKTAVLEGLTRIFGIQAGQRTVTRDDFHYPPEEPTGTSTRELFIEITFELDPDELSDQRESPSRAAAIAYRNLAVQSKGAPPTCGIRLDAKWTDDGTLEGSVSSRLTWMNLPNKGTDNSVTDQQRSAVQVHYLQASRDSRSLMNLATQTMAQRLFRATIWGTEVREKYKKASHEANELFLGEDAVRTITQSIGSRWAELNDNELRSKVSLLLMQGDFESVARNPTITFDALAPGFSTSLDSLSDGERSLFYFSLAAAAFDVESKVHSKTGHQGFDVEKLSAPVLTVFAVEEPENHLAPYYLSRILSQLQTMTSASSVQAILTTHSPSMMYRIPPESVRHSRVDQSKRLAKIASIALPTKKVEQQKYVREAITAFPELYFARCAIFVEGDSEQVVLPKLALALNTKFDPSFIAVVPLGGRHVNHFWKLVTELGIPHLTLLDLDLGRAGAGWGRIKYACKQLMINGVKASDILVDDAGTGAEQPITRALWTDLHKRPVNIAQMLRWISALEKHNVFFSTPLDLDLMMLRHYPAAYGNSQAKIAKLKKCIDRSALGLEGCDRTKAGYTDEFAIDDLIVRRYRFLFRTNDKPGSHLAALAKLTDSQVVKDCPAVLTRLITKAADLAAGK